MLKKCKLYVCMFLQGSSMKITYSVQSNINIWSNKNIVNTGFCFLDIDECATDDGGCENTCTNTPGSFKCSCPTGFVLDLTRRNCSGEIYHSITYFIQTLYLYKVSFTLTITVIV